MNTREAYDLWSEQYDTNVNKTRDLESIALQDILDRIEFRSCLEIGCGTGKNTRFLMSKAASVTAVDLSGEMLAKAKQKIISSNVVFKQADILQPWDFAASDNYELVTFSLVLEHIENLEDIFENASRRLAPGGHVYVGELHPYKQYSGSKARFETSDGLRVVPCFNHHVSDFLQAAQRAGLRLVELKEYFDGGHTSAIPRILMMLFTKPEHEI